MLAIKSTMAAFKEFLRSNLSKGSNLEGNDAIYTLGVDIIVKALSQKNILK